MNVLLTFLGIASLIAAGALLVAGISTRRRGLLYGAFAAVLVGITLLLVGMTIVSVGPNERIVVFNRVTGNLADPRGPGFTLINPLVTSYRVYDISRQTYTMSSTSDEGDLYGDDAVEARTAGGQEVQVEVTVIYAINPDKVNQIHINWPEDRYRNELVRPLLRSVIRDTISEFDIESVIQQRQDIISRMQETIVARMEAEGFIVTDILLRDISFTEEYAAAIENAQIAEVRIREEEFKVQAVEQQAEQVKAEAEGAAEARRIQAAAEADALNLLAQVLQENPSLLEYQYVQNLSDNVQVIALPANSPFIFDIQSLLDQNTAPAPSGE